MFTVWPTQKILDRIRRYLVLFLKGFLKLRFLKSFEQVFSPHGRERAMIPVHPKS